ncbi:hypothetical protein GCM10009800_36360 [Nocardiopsis rhodophaea]
MDAPAHGGRASGAHWQPREVQGATALPRAEVNEFPKVLWSAVSAEVPTSAERVPRMPSRESAWRNRRLRSRAPNRSVSRWTASAASSSNVGIAPVHVLFLCKWSTVRPG